MILFVSMTNTVCFYILDTLNYVPVSSVSLKNYFIDLNLPEDLVALHGHCLAVQ